MNQNRYVIKAERAHISDELSWLLFREKTQDHEIMVSFDVERLFTNIPLYV